LSALSNKNSLALQKPLAIPLPVLIKRSMAISVLKIRVALQKENTKGNMSSC